MAIHRQTSAIHIHSLGKTEYIIVRQIPWGGMCRRVISKAIVGMCRGAVVGRPSSSTKNELISLRTESLTQFEHLVPPNPIPRNFSKGEVITMNLSVVVYRRASAVRSLMVGSIGYGTKVVSVRVVGKAMVGFDDSVVVGRPSSGTAK